MMFLLLALLAVILHECGHYLAALACRLPVRKFCIFFDPGFHIASTGKHFKTEYCLGWLPLGGYVALKPHGDGEENDSESVLEKSPRKNLVFMLAGPAVNILLAFVCMFAYTQTYIDTHHTHTVQEKLALTTHILQDATGDYYHYLVELATGKVKALPEKEQQTAASADTSAKEEKVHQRHRSFFSLNFVMHRDLWRFSLINLFLFLFNILPIPPLDGGQALSALYRIVFRRKINDIAFVLTYGLGALLLIIFIVYSNTIDIIRFCCS